MKSKLTVGLVAILLLFAGWFVYQRLRHASVFEVSDAGLEPIVDWSNSNFQFYASPIELQCDNRYLVPAQQLGEALTFYRSIRVLTLNRMQSSWLTEFFAAWPSQQNVLEVYLLYLPLYDKDLSRLVLPDLQKALFKELPISGVGIPFVPSLCYLEIDGCPISKEGMIHLISSCPKLADLIIVNGSISAADFAQFIHCVPKSLKKLTVTQVGWHDGEVEQLRLMCEKLAPSVEILINGR